MGKYLVTIAYNVPCYGTVEIEAPSQEAAERRADRLERLWAIGLGDFADVPRWIHVKPITDEE
jgi:hypothetical protein